MMKRNLLAVVAVCIASIVFAETSDAQRRFAVEMEMALKDKGSAKNRQPSTILRGADAGIATSTNAQSCILRPYYGYPFGDVAKKWKVSPRIKNVDDLEARQKTEEMFDLWVETLEAYKAAHNGVLPSYKEQDRILAEASPTKAKVIKDPWGSPIHWIRSATGSYGIVSAGPDMVIDTNDDIVRGDPDFIACETRRAMGRGSDRSGRRATEKMLDQMVEIFEAYKVAHGGELPSKDEESHFLAAVFHADPRFPTRDVWGRPIVCMRGHGQDADLYEFVSVGADRSPNTDDDIARGDAFRLRESSKVESLKLSAAAETNEVQKLVLELQAKMEAQERQRAPRQRALKIERLLDELERHGADELEPNRPTKSIFRNRADAGSGAVGFDRREWRRLRKIADDSSEACQATEKRLEQWVEATDAYKAAHEGVLPSWKEQRRILAEVCHEDLSEGIIDAWGNCISFWRKEGEGGDAFVFVSSGPDGRMGTPDDIVRGDSSVVPDGLRDRSKELAAQRERQVAAFARKSEETRLRRSALEKKVCIKLFALSSSVKSESENLQALHKESLAYHIDRYLRDDSGINLRAFSSDKARRRLDELLRGVHLDGDEENRLMKEFDEYVAIIESEKNAVSVARLQELKDAAAAYIAEGNSSLRGFSETVWHNASATLPTRDGWNNDISVRFQDKKFRFSSNGPDGKPNTSDDIVAGNWE